MFHPPTVPSRCPGGGPPAPDRRVADIGTRARPAPRDVREDGSHLETAAMGWRVGSRCVDRKGEGRTTWYEWVARAIALALCMGIVVGVWLVLYGFKPWPGLERTLATYPVPPGWTS